MALNVEKLLKELEDAGVDTAVLKEHTGDFTASLESFVEDIGSERAQEATQELQTWKDKFDEADKASRSKDAAMSQMDLKVKDLEAKLAKAATTTPDTDAAVTAALESVRTEVGGQIQGLMEKLEAQETENQRLAAEVRRNEQIALLAKEFPVLEKAKFRDLIPNTSDETVLRERAKLLTDFNKETQDAAFQQFRDGYVPPTAPPRVKPGDAESAQAEVQRISTLLDTGELSYEDAQKKLSEVARLARPQP